VVLWASRTSIGTRREASAVAELARLADWAAVRPLHIAAWWLPMTRDVPSSRESVRTDVHTLDVVWLSSADLVGLRMPTPADLTGRERRVCVCVQGV